MSLYRLKRYSEGNGDPIDTSDALGVLNEIEEIKRKSYNDGLDTAISLVRECMDYEDRMMGKEDNIICGLENSKKQLRKDEE